MIGLFGYLASAKLFSDPLQRRGFFAKLVIGLFNLLNFRLCALLVGVQGIISSII